MKFGKIAATCAVATIAVTIAAGCAATPAQAATKWTSWDTQWYANSNVYYFEGNTLYASPNMPHSMGIKTKIASFSKKSTDSLTILAGYGNKLYVSASHSTYAKAAVYSVNVKKKKKVKEISKCRVADSKGRYIYGYKKFVNDTSACAGYVWKIGSKKIKQVKKIGKYIFGATVAGKKLYYASYPNKSQKKMTVYQAKLNGKKKKKLFTVKGKGTYAQALISNVNTKTISAYVSGDEPATYTYTIKTKKLEKQSHAY